MTAKKLLSSNYLKSIFQLTMGSFMAQVISVVVSPISTRLYTPEQLGVYTLIITVVSMFGPVLSGKYDMVIVSAEDEKETINLVFVSAIFSILFITIITVAYRFYLFKNPEIIEEVGGFAYLLVGILIIRAITNILDNYNNKYKEYKIISSVYVIKTLVKNVGLVVFGLLKFGSIGLLLSEVFGSLFGLKKQSKLLYRNRFLFKKISLKGIKRTLFKYRRQPIYAMPAHFINSTSYSLLNFLISGMFGMEVFGYYSMSYRILGLPLSLISMNVSKVFFQKASEEKIKSGNYNKSLKQITLFLICISIPMVIILMTFGPFIFQLIFGKGWNIAGIYVRILAPMFGFRFIVSALIPALTISGKQNLELVLQSLYILGSISSYFISRLLTLDVNGFLVLITVSYSIIYMIFYYNIYKLSKRKQ